MKSSLKDSPSSDELPSRAPGEDVGTPLHLGESQSITPRYPVVAERAEWSEVITLYDRQHFLTYARLLSAERDKLDWRDGVRRILQQDPDRDARAARICWESHLERARWIETVGFQQAIDQARAQ